jgi:hypothetical protein
LFVDGSRIVLTLAASAKSALLDSLPWFLWVFNKKKGVLVEKIRALGGGGEN